MDLDYRHFFCICNYITLNLTNMDLDYTPVPGGIGKLTSMLNLTNMDLDT